MSSYFIKGGQSATVPISNFILSSRHIEGEKSTETDTKTSKH